MATSIQEETSRPVTFSGSGNYQLAGIYQQAGEETTASIVLSHCFTCSKEYKILSWLARDLAEAGVASLRWDFAGLGQSGGDFAATTLSTDIEDLGRAAAWLQEETGQRPCLLGHSMGGAASILAADGIEAPGVVVLATGMEVGRVLRLLSERHRQELADQGVAKVDVAGRSFPISRDFLDDLENHSLSEALADFQRPFLIFQGTADRIVTPEQSEQLFAAASQPKTFVAVEGATHLFDRKEDARAIASFLIPWLQLTGKRDSS